MDPFVLMVHSTPADQVCLVVDGVVRPVTDQALGSWLRGLPELRVSVRSLVDPVVMLTCNKGAVCQRLADEVGRLVWFPHGDMKVHAGLLDPADPASGVTWASLQPAPDGHGGRFRSSWPQDAAGARVRWEYGCRFGSDPARWLVERSAVSGFPAPDGLRPYVFGGGRGLSYFDRRDRESRSAALNAPILGSSHVVWTPNDAYRPGTPAPGAVARPWHSRDLGVLPFDLDDVVVVVGYFAGGRFAVYDERRDISHWETPEAFGLRLRKDLAGLGGTARVLLLTDFDAVPDRARREVARGLGGRELITVNTPSTLFLDQDTKGAPEARIALLPGNHATTVPEWTATNATGTSRTLDEPGRRARSEAARDYARSGADFVAAVVELRQAHLRLDQARVVLDGPGSSRSPRVHAAAERRLSQARDRFASAETRLDLAGRKLAPLGLDWLADEHELDAAGITWARGEAATLVGRAPIATGAESLRQGRAAEALAIPRTARHTREQPAVAWTSVSQPAPVAWEKMTAGTAEALRARARTVVAQFARPPVFLEHATETQLRLWTVHGALVDRVAYRIHQTEHGRQPADRKTPEDLARTLVTDLGLPRAPGLAGGAPPTRPAPPDPAPTGPSRYAELRQLLVDWKPKDLEKWDPGDTLEAYITGNTELSAAFLLSKGGRGKFVDPGTREALRLWVLKWDFGISSKKVAKWSGTLIAGSTVLDIRNAERPSNGMATKKQTKKLVNWNPGKGKGDALDVYISGDADLRAAFPLETDDNGEFVNLGTRRAVNRWALRWRGSGTTAGEVAKMSGRLLDQESVSRAWGSANAQVKATPEQIGKLVNWAPANPEDPEDTLDAYIAGNADLRVAFPLRKHDSGVFLDGGTREAVREWILEWRDVVSSRVVARWSGKLVARSAVLVVWNSEGSAKKGVTPEQVEKLAGWAPNHEGDTLEAYITGDTELRVAFPLGRYGGGGFIDPDTRKAMRRWVLGWIGKEVDAWEVVEWSGGLLKEDRVATMWRVATGEKVRDVSGGNDGVVEERARKRLKLSSGAAVEAFAQSAKAAELGLRLVDVPRDGDCFYAAVLRTVEREVWEPQLTFMGKELSSDGLRQAVADAYRLLNPYDVVDSASETRIRTRGQWDSESGDIAERLVPDVLGVNLKTITRAGGVSADGVEIHDDRPTYYLAYNGVNHYLATAPLTPAPGQAPHTPTPPAQAGTTGTELPMRGGGESAPPLEQAARSAAGTPRPTSAAPASLVSGNGPALAGIPEEVRDAIVSLVPPKDGFATLRAALEDALGPDVDLGTSTIRKLVGEWALCMLDTTPSTPAEVADLSDGLITVHEVVTLYNTTHAGGIGDTGSIHWEDQAHRRITWPASERPARPEVVENRLHPIVGMDDQFPFRDAKDPLNRVHALFSDADGELHPALRARAHEITARISEGKSHVEWISQNEDDPRLPVMTPAKLRARWAALERESAKRMQYLVRTSRNPAPGTVQLAPLHPSDPKQTVYVTKVKKNHVASQERALIGAYQLCLAHPPGSIPLRRQPAFTNNRFLHFYLGALLNYGPSTDMQQREEQDWAKRHPNYPSYVIQAGRESTGNLVAAEGAANSLGFANAAVTIDGELDETRTNVALVTVTFTFPDITKPTGTFEVKTIIFVALDNAFDPIANPYGILLANYGEKYKIAVKEEPEE
ncbi:hypothetical protein [Amycolatopsis japonica]